MAIQAGDTVQVSPNTHIKGALGESFDATLVSFPTQQFPYWILETDTRILYMQNITVSKLI